MKSLLELPKFSVSQRVYSRLLLAYPRRHRAEYGPAMAQLFHDQCRDAWNKSGRWGLLKLWLRVLPDLVSTSIGERLAALNERKSMTDKLANLFSFRISPIASFFSVFVPVFILVFGLSVAITFLLPESYASTARIRVEPESANVPGDAPPSVPAPAYDPYFIQTTMEIIQDHVVLGKVVDDLNLNESWGKKYNGRVALKTPETMELLKSRMSLTPIRSTRLIGITVYSEDRNEAARIANAVAEAYRAYRLDQRKSLTLNDITVLQSQFEQRDMQIQRLTAEVESLRQQHKIPLDAEGPQSAQEQTYWEGKRDLERMTEINKLLAARIEAERSDLMVTKASPAEIVGRAEPGEMPARPNKPLNIVLGALLGVFLASFAGIIAALLAFQIRKRMRRMPSAA